MKRPTFEQAKARYPHRFTMEHVPQWARTVRPDGTYYAPQYRSCREWYENTIFPGEAAHILGQRHGGACDSRGASWPLGQSLSAPHSATRAVA